MDEPPQHPKASALAQAWTHRIRRRLLGPSHGRPRPLPESRRWLRILGPGLVTGAADDDPSGIGTYSQAGAAFGASQLWLALYMLPMLIAVQEMCARIGLVTGMGIAAVLRKHYSRPVLFVAVGLVFIANTLNIGADLGAMAATLQLFAPGVPFLLLLVALAVGILALEIFVPYRRYAVVLKVLALSLLAYVVTGFIVGPSGVEMFRATVVPTIQLTAPFLALIVGVLGTTISPYLFFWQASEEVEETELHPLQSASANRIRQRRILLAQIHALRLDTVIGMFSSEVATWFIIFTTGSVLHEHGVTNITSADQAAQALQPLVHTFPYAGELARIIFALGILGVGLLGIPVLAGSEAYAVAEAFHWHEGLSKQFHQAPGFYLVMGTAIVVGAALNLFHINPIAALVYSAIINGVVAVPLLALILLIANNKAIMKSFTNGRLSNVVVTLTTVAMGAAALAMIFLFFKQ